ncbi:DUF1810 domain-containing protein [Alkalimarinus coralli]|uniref:DUF1810 domain-containing protein n=1 Tax=Alkalimarinus coralli TaxID=2935863 RepID=UPI00202AF76E|nr:DUF1810 domain-containing protein [Alkalimarinus coralli]
MEKRTNDIFNLHRFVQAQESCYERVKEELTKGKKQTHWMWYIFPQIDGLARSATSKQYAITSLAEADAYLKESVLGSRLIESTRLVLNIEGGDIEEIFGYPDYLKFQSSMTLFSQVEGASGIFEDAIDKFYRGKFDNTTLVRLDRL